MRHQIFAMLKDIQVSGQKDTRSGFGDGIVEAARKNPNVVALTADLAGSLKLNQFMKEFPERYIQCGIAEANMMGIAAGLTIGGKIPFNTDGGLIARGHPGGPTGLAMIYEIVQQLRGNAGKRQVKNARTGLAHLVGGGSVCSVCILQRD